jgi:hypothetical protein
MTKAKLVSHLQQTYHDTKNEAFNIHAINMPSLGLLWQVDLKHIINPVARNLPTYAELHSASVGPRKDHIILVYRQPGKQLDFHDAYAGKISATTVPNL